MLPQYRQAMNRQALAHITKAPDDPTARMGIGEDERMGHMDMRLEYITKRNSVVIPDADTAPYMAIPGKDDYKVDPDDFPNTHYVGEAIEEV